MKNLLRGICVIIIIQIFCATYASCLNLKEHDVCTTDGDYCTKLTNCPYYNIDDVKKRKFQPPLCGYNGTNPIVCCTTHFNNMFGFGRRTRSAEMCAKYEHDACSSGSSQFGRLGNPNEIPFMALLGYGQNNNISWRCSGSVISTRYILSAARCSNTEDIGPAKWVKIGNDGTSTPSDTKSSQYFSVISYVNHPAYRSSSLYNDIALYKLDKEIDFKNYINPACLHQYISILTHRTVMTAGWGKTNSKNISNLKLKTHELNLLPINDCIQSTDKTQLAEGFHKRGMICAGDRKSGEDTCSGLPGQPIFLPPNKGQIDKGCFLYIQVGLRSGYQCNDNHSIIYTNVANYLRWIESVVWPEDISLVNERTLTTWD